MPYRVAVAAQPGRMVTQHFGRATVFHVFDRLEGEWVLAESRVSDPTCGPEGDAAASHDSLLAYAADLVSDCDAVLAARIGPGAVQRLSERGVEAYAMHALIDDALAALGEAIEKHPSEQGDGTGVSAAKGSEADITATKGHLATDRQE